MSRPRKKRTLDERRADTAAATAARAAPLPSLADLPLADDDGSDGMRVLHKPVVLDVVGEGYPTIWKWMQEGKFPRARAMGGKTVWLKSEIDAWISALPIRQLKGDAV